MGLEEPILVIDSAASRSEMENATKRNIFGLYARIRASISSNSEIRWSPESEMSSAGIVGVITSYRRPGFELDYRVRLQLLGLVVRARNHRLGPLDRQIRHFLDALTRKVMRPVSFHRRDDGIRGRRQGDQSQTSNQPSGSRWLRCDTQFRRRDNNKYHQHNHHDYRKYFMYGDS